MTSDEFATAFRPYIHWPTIIKKRLIFRTYTDIYKKSPYKYADIRFLDYCEAQLSEYQKIEYLQKAQENLASRQAFIDTKAIEYNLFIKNIVTAKHIIHPVTNKPFATNNSKKIIDVAAYSDITLAANIGQLNITCNPHIIIHHGNNLIDIIQYSPPLPFTIAYARKSHFGHVRTLQFPLDHLANNKISFFSLNASSMAIIFEHHGYKINQLIVVYNNETTILPYKKWEVQLMSKYFKYLPKHDTAAPSE